MIVIVIAPVDVIAPVIVIALVNGNANVGVIDAVAGMAEAVNDPISMSVGGGSIAAIAACTLA